MAVRGSFDMDGLARGLEKDLARAVTAGVKAATDAVKADVREETFLALGFRNSLPKAWRGEVFPRSGDSVDAAGWVKVRGSAAVIIDAHSKGVVIRANRGKWLAVPTPEAGRFGLKAGMSGMGATTNRRGSRERITPAGFERRTGLKLRFVPGKGGRAFLVADKARLNRRSGGILAPYAPRGRGAKLYGPDGQTFVAFTLVRQVTLKKRLDLDAVAERAAGVGATLIATAWGD